MVLPPGTVMSGCPRCGALHCPAFGVCPCIPSKICHPHAKTGGQPHAQPLCRSPWQMVGGSLGGVLDAYRHRRRGGRVLRALLTPQMWPPPHSNEPARDFLRCPSSGSDSDVASNIPTGLLSHLEMTLQSMNGCGQRQLWSQAPKSHGATTLGWPNPWPSRCGTLRLPGAGPCSGRTRGAIPGTSSHLCSHTSAPAANQTIRKPNHLHPSTLQHQRAAELPNRSSDISYSDLIS